MSNKYYLLRRNQETLLGPHNLAEIVSLYQNKKCSTNDEISGNTGPWVYLRSRDELKKHYPEMVGIFHSTVAKENLISAYEKYESKPRKSSSPLTFMLFAVVLVGVAAAGYYLYHRHQSDALRSVMKYHRNQDYSRAMEIMRADAALVDKMSVSLASSKKWLPVLRTFAFWDDTKLKPSLMAAIREQSAVKTPANCSQASWRKIWRASMSSWEELLTQQNLLVPTGVSCYHGIPFGCERELSLIGTTLTATSTAAFCRPTMPSLACLCRTTLLRLSFVSVSCGRHGHWLLPPTTTARYILLLPVRCSSGTVWSRALT